MVLYVQYMNAEIYPLWNRSQIVIGFHRMCCADETLITQFGVHAKNML